MLNSEQQSHAIESPDGSHAAVPRVVLCVDDEPRVLDGLKRILRRYGYRVLTAENGTAGLQVLELEPAPVVISDYRMPGMSGAEFLAEVRRAHPDTMRILLTGHADMEGVASALNDGGMYKFLSKPCSDLALTDAVGECFRLLDLEEENSRLTSELKRANAELDSLNRDLEEQVRVKAEALIYAEYFDALTDLPNATLLRDRIKQVIAGARRNDGAVTLLLIGLNEFQVVTDSLGRAGADAVLRELAERFREDVRPSDTLARLHTGEFCLSCKAGPEDPSTIAQRLLDVLDRPLDTPGGEIRLSASVGISVFPTDGQDPQTLIDRAQSALHDARRQGQGAIRYYARELNERAVKRLSATADLRRAVENEEFILHFQPRVDGDTGAIVGAEALIRWQHPTRGLLLPGEFLPLLEETGLIEPVGDWVLREACAALGRWRRSEPQVPKLSVNLSARQFGSARLVDTIQQAAHDNGSVQQFLELEITETVLMQDAVQAVRQLERLKALEVQLAIDDFGTGYSSLSYLIQFPFDYVKVDRSFVADVVDNPDANAIVQTIISLAAALRLEVIAEGVECAEQVAALKAMGCRQFQGYYFGRPVPESLFLERLASAALTEPA